MAGRLLLAAQADVNHHGGLMKLGQLIIWEILLVESHQLHAEWPNKTTGTLKHGSLVGLLIISAPASKAGSHEFNYRTVVV